VFALRRNALFFALVPVPLAYLLWLKAEFLADTVLIVFIPNCFLLEFLLELG
jgi:hypothetical protein